MEPESLAPFLMQPTNFSYFLYIFLQRHFYNSLPFYA